MPSRENTDGRNWALLKITSCHVNFIKDEV